MYVPADEQQAYADFKLGLEVLKRESARGGRGRVAISSAIEFTMDTASVVNVLVQIVSDLQKREQVHQKQLGDLMEYIVKRDATPEAHAAMAAAGVEYDLEETKRRLAEIAAKGIV